MSVCREAIERFAGRTARLGVVGLGYAGLPLACAFSEAGLTTLGFDIDPVKIQKLSRSESYIRHIPGERLARIVADGRFQPVNDFAALRACDAAIVCVPTPLAEARIPDLTFVIETTKSIAAHLHRGQLVVLESTTYPGTVEQVMLPILSGTGLKVGEDFFLAFSPEREDPANTEFSTSRIPKVVGGVTRNCLEVACAAYRLAIDDVVPVSSARIAEASKLLENIYRCVNIALVNELKMLFDRMSIDIWEVIAAASTKPFGFKPFYPGPGWGGHCIPIDPFYLSWKARQYGFVTRFIELAGEINTAMPAYVIKRLSDALAARGKKLDGARVLLIGVAYKCNVDDVRESPALAIIQLLEAAYAKVSYYDPYVPVLKSRHLSAPMSSIELSANAVRGVDAAIVVTDHSDIDYQMIVNNAELVIDTRNATRSCHSPKGNVVTA